MVNLEMTHTVVIIYMLIYMCMYAAIFHADIPHGVLPDKVCTWDRQMLGPELLKIWQNVTASTEGSDNLVFSIMHKPTDAEMVSNMMKDQNMKDRQNYFWDKGRAHSTPAAPNLFVNTVEMGTCAHTVGKDEAKGIMAVDPRLRQNIFTCPTVRRPFCDSKGDVYNITQKPPELFRWLCESWAPAGSWVLIGCGGIGGDVEGAVQAGMNVVVVESDEKQYRGIIQHMFAINNRVIQEREAKIASQEQTLKKNTVTGDNQSKAAQLMSQTPKIPVVVDKNVPKIPPKCPDCGEQLPEGYDKDKHCQICADNKPLHDNCCEVQSDMTYICATCIEKNEEEEVKII